MKKLKKPLKSIQKRVDVVQFFSAEALGQVY